MDEALKTIPELRQPLSVSDLTRNLKQCLGDFFPDTWVVGEVSQFSEHRMSKHWYFQIKDKHSVLSCVMYRGRNQVLGWHPQPGDQVFIAGSIDIYPPSGSYSLNVRELRAVGEGAHRQRIEALKRQLQAEGLLDPRRKRRLPAMPRAIGVATSGSGAAFHDIRRVLDQRFPNVTIYLASCRVQGSGAAEEIARAIGLLNAHGRSEVLIVGRGGGSRDDLAAFDEEVVARAIANSRIPVISAVGHEVDNSVADLVADVRAATPSHAAELVVPERTALLERTLDAEQRLIWAARRAVDRRRQEMRRIVLRSPQQRIDEARQRLDDLSARLQQAMLRELVSRRQVVRVAQVRLRHPQRRIDDARLRSTELRQRLQQAMQRALFSRRQDARGVAGRLRDPRPRIDEARQRIALLETRLHEAQQRRQQRERQRLIAAAAQLQALSPLAVLSRGYALALHDDGRAVRRAAELAPGEEVTLRLAQGQARARILSTEESTPPEGTDTSSGGGPMNR